MSIMLRQANRVGREYLVHHFELYFRESSPRWSTCRPHSGDNNEGDDSREDIEINAVHDFRGGRLP